MRSSCSTSPAAIAGHRILGRDVALEFGRAAAAMGPLKASPAHSVVMRPLLRLMEVHVMELAPLQSFLNTRISPQAMGQGIIRPSNALQGKRSLRSSRCSVPSGFCKEASLAWSWCFVIASLRSRRFMLQSGARFHVLLNNPQISATVCTELGSESCSNGCRRMAKKPEWSAPWGLGATCCRGLNQKADTAANGGEREPEAFQVGNSCHQRGRCGVHCPERTHCLRAT